MEIKTSNGYTVTIDDEDAKKVCKYKWYATIGGRKTRNTRYAICTSTRKRLAMHRFIIDAPKGTIVDHINGNGLDNRKDNLRICTNKQNVAHSKLRTDNTLGYRGIGITHYGAYEAHVYINSKKKHIGVFNTPEDAARVRDIEAIKLYGEFVSLNFPDEHKI